MGYKIKRYSSNPPITMPRIQTSNKGEISFGPEADAMKREFESTGRMMTGSIPGIK